MTGTDDLRATATSTCLCRGDFDRGPVPRRVLDARKCLTCDPSSQVAPFQLPQAEILKEPHFSELLFGAAQAAHNLQLHEGKLLFLLGKQSQRCSTGASLLSPNSPDTLTLGNCGKRSHPTSSQALPLQVTTLVPIKLSLYLLYC